MLFKTFFSYLMEGTGIRKMHSLSGKEYVPIKKYFETKLGMKKPVYYKIADLSIPYTNIIDNIAKIVTSDKSLAFLYIPSIPALIRIRKTEDGIQFIMLFNKMLGDKADSKDEISIETLLEKYKSLDILEKRENQVGTKQSRTNFKLWHQTMSSDLEKVTAILVVHNGEVSPAPEEEQEEISSPQEEPIKEPEQKPEPKKRGRPKKNPSPNTEPEQKSEPKKRGRPRKSPISFEQYVEKPMKPAVKFESRFKKSSLVKFEKTLHDSIQKLDTKNLASCERSLERITSQIVSLSGIKDVKVARSVTECVSTLASRYPLIFTPSGSEEFGVKTKAGFFGTKTGMTKAFKEIQKNLMNNPEFIKDTDAKVDEYLDKMLHLSDDESLEDTISEVVTGYAMPYEERGRKKIIKDFLIMCGIPKDYTIRPFGPYSYDYYIHLYDTISGRYVEEKTILDLFNTISNDIKSFALEKLEISPQQIFENFKKVVSERIYTERFQNMGVGKSELKSASLGKNVFACCMTYGGVILNTTYYSNSMEEFEKIYEKSVRYRFHPKGTTMKSILYHEYGHYITNYLTTYLYSGPADKSPVDKIRELYRLNNRYFDKNDSLYDIDKGVSQYASYNYEEFIAESFSMCIEHLELYGNLDDVPEIAKETFEIINECYAKYEKETEEKTED